jgi:hypothetical protein
VRPQAARFNIDVDVEQFVEHVMAMKQLGRDFAFGAGAPAGSDL